MVDFELACGEISWQCLTIIPICEILLFFIHRYMCENLCLSPVFHYNILLHLIFTVVFFISTCLQLDFWFSFLMKSLLFTPSYFTHSLSNYVLNLCQAILSLLLCYLWYLLHLFFQLSSPYRASNWKILLQSVNLSSSGIIKISRLKVGNLIVNF